MSEIKVDKISPESGTAFTIGDSGDTFTVPSGATIVNSGTATGFGGGKIGQVLQVVNSAEETFSGTTPTLIPDLTIAITPAASTSKVLVMVAAQVVQGGAVSPITQLFRDTTQIYMGDAASNRPRAIFSGYLVPNRSHPSSIGIYLDSPSTTSEIEYSLKWFSQTATMFLNRSITDNDQTTYDARTPSSITVMEVLA